jgi:hypothetical protein
VPKGRNYRVITAVLQEMNRQRLGPARLAARLEKAGYSWSTTYLVLRLGELMPATPATPAGGRYPLLDGEVVALATALRVPVAQLAA